MNQAVGDIDRMTQQNAALVEESAAAAESLKEQAARLAGVVQQFKLDHQASAGYAQPHAGFSGVAQPQALRKPAQALLS